LDVDAPVGKAPAMDPLVWQDALEQGRAIRDGETTALDLTTTMLERIERWNPTLRAYVSVDTEGALAGARAADAFLAEHGPDGAPPFLGVTLSIKDVIGVKGLPTTQSSKALADAVAADDDPLVRRFRAAGFVILGTTNVPEFCTSMTWSDLNGLCRNPWNLDHTPGGSSGGAGAATAARLCAMAHGTDGAGSVRAPAAFCGLVGLKPSRGMVAFGPFDDPIDYGTSGPGVLTRSVRDAAAGLDVLVGNDTTEPAWSPRPPRPYLAALDHELPRLRIAVCSTFPRGEIDAESIAAVEDVGELLASLGHSVEVAAPDWSLILGASRIPLSVPGPAGLVEPEADDLLEPRNRDLVAKLRRLTVVDHARSVGRARTAAREFWRFWDDHDVLVTPTYGAVAPQATMARWDFSVEEHHRVLGGIANFAQPFNVSGQPALSLPLAWSGEGLPIGVQLAGRFLDEALLLRLAAELEVAQPWADRVPPGFD
jgi:amidase